MKLVECPRCYFQMNKMTVQEARYNFDCPRCKKVGIKDFRKTTFKKQKTQHRE